MADLPIVVGPAGYIPQTPAALRAALIAAIQQVNTGYTANLPGTLIEDISSTDVYALLQCDSSVAELINSITPYGANAWLLNQLGNIYGVQKQAGYYTSAYVEFGGPPGWNIIPGFTVSDGIYQYTVQDGVLIGDNSVSALTLVIATTSGAWAIPAGAITEVVTSTPDNVVITVTNPEPGTPAVAAESETGFRTRVLQAGLANSQGVTRYLKTLLQNIPGVQPNLVSTRLITQPNGYQDWEVICGGSGDPDQIANAIFRSIYLGNLTGSTIYASGITAANPAVVTTNLNHGYATGQVITMFGCQGGGFLALNNTPFTITVVDEKTFSLNGIDTTSFGTYTAGSGYVTPNFRNITRAVLDYPDTYSITFVNPPAQTVAMVVTWNTYTANYVNDAVVAQLALQPLIDYINGIFVGQPINVFEMNSVFQIAVASVLPTQQLTRLVFAVSINGIGTAPVSGTGEILGDPESYFLTDSTQIVITRG